MKTRFFIFYSLLTIQLQSQAQWITYPKSSDYDKINAIAIDSQGNKWFATGNGVKKFDGITWTTYFFDGKSWSTNNKGVISGVHSIAIDEQGNKWFGTFTCLSKFDGVNSTIFSWNYAKRLNCIPKGSVDAITIDADGNKWFAINTEVSKFDGINWITFTKDSGLVDGSVNAIAIDAQNNKWFGTSRGVSKFDRVNWTTYNKDNSPLISYGVTLRVNAIAIDSKDNKWFGTNKGVFIFDGIKWTKAKGLADYNVSTIVIDKQDNKWVGTYDAGVSKFDGTNWTSYNMADGLVSYDVRAIAIDVQGNLWFGTPDGISKFSEGSAKTKEQTTIKTTSDIKIVSKVTSFSDVDDSLPQTKNINNNSFAVVIGNKNYINTSQVDYAINDAKTIKQYLVKVLGFKEGNIFYIENATKSIFETYFGNNDNPYGKIYNNVKPDSSSDIFIYYAGHGAPGLKDNKGYFLPTDCDPQYIEQGGYSLDLFYRNLSKLPAKSITVITDACFSGGDIIKNISSVKTKIIDPIITIKNCVVLSSSTSSQVSTWYNEKQHGMFTYFFLKAIQDKEKSDANKDNKLTFKEIFNYVSDNSEGVPYYARSIQGVEQTPTITGTGIENIFIEYK